MLKHLAEAREHEREVLLKATEVRDNFTKMTKENITQKMEAYKENRVAQRAALNEKFKARVSSSCLSTLGVQQQQQQQQHPVFCSKQDKKLEEVKKRQIE